MGDYRMNAYQVWSEDCGQTEASADRIMARDPESAARDWAEWRDMHTAEFEIAGGKAVRVTVEQYGTRHQFIVTGEAVACYRARKV